ncbi:MAG: hypothetical protein WCK76_14725, partial [Elusimicrobiota bacterium]
SLRAPSLPSGKGQQAEQTARKYPLFQELASVKQEIQDDFSKARLGLRKIAGRVDGDRTAAAIKRAKKAVPAPEPRPVSAQEASMTAQISALPGDSPAAAASARAVSPETRESGRPGVNPFQVVTALILCAVVVLAFSLGRPPRGQAAFPLPHTQAAGLCLAPEGSRLFFLDPQRQLLFTVSSPGGMVRSVEGFPAGAARALAFDGEFFWSVGDKGIVKHKAGGRYSALETYPEAGSGVSALFWDGKYLWAGGAPGGQLNRYLPGGSLAPAGSYAMPAVGSPGISISGETLFTLDTAAGKLCAYKLGGAMEPFEEAGLAAFLPRKGRVAGFAMDNTYLWLITENPAELRRVNLSRLKFVVNKP